MHLLKALPRGKERERFLHVTDEAGGTDVETWGEIEGMKLVGDCRRKVYGALAEDFEQCKPHKRSVCGSNGKTYRNHCELHRDACLTGLKIQVAHDGHCKERKTEKAAASPVVCYVGDRNELRRRVIEWLQTEVVPDGWFTKGSNFTDILLKYFKKYWNSVIIGTVSAEKTPALEPVPGDETMTEEEWSLRVAELNKHQDIFTGDHGADEVQHKGGLMRKRRRRVHSRDS
ncbi:Follistatin-related protein 1 [Bagarius yarrelli]|uniref:Follistatin-related protein 1 n=1 Tax=Bagarius yarrelli TaxID=175774 RepID=A0A556U023_BAGYA|nr:Follistatin-related protein 1 [Bagarius yarrelli]